MANGVTASLPLALTMGEPAGIGGELTLMAWESLKNSQTPFFVIDDPERLRAIAGQLGLNVPVQVISHPAEALAAFAHALPVLPELLARPVQPGKPDAANVRAVENSIRRAVELTLGGQACGVVTNPIHKGVMYEGGFRFPGHTEFLAHLLKLDGFEVMMLVCAELKVIPVTIHISLRQAIADLSTDRIVQVARITHDALVKDFGIAAPRLAIAGLNPHAGEDGAMGREDMDIVAPAIAKLKECGINAFGPLPPDTMFHKAARAHYDVAICMYHDQALIPIKTIGFDEGVNITLGLPIIRTSPDHGTAFGIAGTGKANPQSLIEALKTGYQIAQNRKSNG